MAREVRPQRVNMPTGAQLDPTYKSAGLRLRLHWAATSKEAGHFFRYALYVGDPKNILYDQQKKQM
jgi:hypothetical protein